MGAAAGERVEFLDLLPDASGGSPGLGGLDGSGGARHRVRGACCALLVVTAVFAAARVLGAPPPVLPAAAAAEAPVFAGEVALPAGFGTPLQLVTAAAAGDDVVWVLGGGGHVVRIADGRVTRLSAGRGYHGLAARPDGRAVFVTTGRSAPSVEVLDPDTLDATGRALALAPVTALAAGVGSLWAASSAGVQGWTSDLLRPLRTLRIPAEVTAVRSLAVVGPGVQAVVTTTPGTTALLRLEPAGRAPQLTSAFAGPVSIVPGQPALVAHVDAQQTVEVLVDPSEPGDGVLGRPLSVDASIWPAQQLGTTAWLVSTRVSGTLECFDATGQLVGRTALGDDGHAVRGPVVTTPRAVYAVTAQGELVRGGPGSCGAVATR